MAGHHVDAARVLSDQLVQTPPRLDRRVAIVGERQDASRVLAPHADEVGDAVHQDPCLARARAREHQHVGALPVVGDNSLLGPVPELPDNRLEVFGKGVASKRRLLAPEPLVDECLAGEFEVVHRQAQRQVDVIHAELRILGDHVDLCGLLGVVLLQRLEIRDREGPSVSLDLQRHRRAEDGESTVESDDLLLVHPEQRAVDERLGRLVLQLRLQHQVVPDCLLQRPVGGFHQQVDPADTVRHLAKKMFEKPGRAVAAKPRDAIDGVPGPAEAHSDSLHVSSADLDAALGVGLVTAVGGDAPKEPHQPFGQRVLDVLHAKSLGDRAKRKAGPAVDLLVGRLLAKLRYEGLFQCPGKRQAPG